MVLTNTFFVRLKIRITVVTQFAALNTPPFFQNYTKFEGGVLGDFFGVGSRRQMSFWATGVYTI